MNQLLADTELQILLGLVAGILVLATIAGLIGRSALKGEGARKTFQNILDRTRAWWMMTVFFVGAALVGPIGSLVLFGLLSFLALREYMTLTPTKRADHRTLFYAFFVATPVQYYLISIDWYEVFSIFIPVYVFLFIPMRSVLAGDTERFMERTAVIQWGLLICVYFVSHAPAIVVLLDLAGGLAENAKLLFYFVLVVELGDVCQYLWGKILGRHKLSPTVSPNKTWEGFIGGILTATAIGAALYWATPFNPWQAALMSLLVTVTGTFGDLTLSAIKRDRGVKDYGALLRGHGGILDRIDSLCFAAPVFFHLTRYFFTS